MKIVINGSYKSIPRGLEFELPKFCLLTGKNGSGKSHLLEAISNRQISTVIIDGTVVQNVHHVGYNGLNPQVDEQSDQGQVIGHINNFWNQTQGIINHYKGSVATGAVYQDIVTQYLPQHGQNPVLHSIIGRALKQTKKGLDELTQDDIAGSISFTEISPNQLFFAQCALIFKAYHTRKIKNDFAAFRNHKAGNITFPHLSDEQFIDKYGPAPWDLINDILARAGLSYQVLSPEVGDFELPYRLRLLDNQRNVDIAVNDLSSGEKVLMSLALAIYNTGAGGVKPNVLLLDEPDAPLHPQFSKLLIDTVVETIVEKAGVNVIVTTHSPSTVALAPEGSVFEVDRNNKRPSRVTNAYAVSVLTEGIDFLRISYENRRQIFVESKYDVQYFQRLYAILSRKTSFTYQPVFLEPHSGTSNCTDVISIVDRLRSSGSDIAYGLIDFDDANTSTDIIVVLGEGQRYAIENYLLDPLYVALALIRSEKKSFADFGIVGKTVYTEAASLSSDDCLLIIKTVLQSIGMQIDDPVPVEFENGYVVNYPKSFLMCQGHLYETNLKSRYAELNAISKGQGDSALKLGLMRVIEEFPQFLPIEIRQTFVRLLGSRI